MSTSLKLEEKSIHNVMATIYGQKDSDYCIVVGATRNGWRAGDGINGTQLLTMVARGLTELFHNATNPWMPKYTVRLVSWGGGDVGDKGMSELLERYAELWRNKVIAYIDLDNPVLVRRKSRRNADGADDDDDDEELNHLTASVSPSLQQLVATLAAEIRSEEDVEFPEITFKRFHHRPAKGLIHTEHAFQHILGAPYIHVQASALRHTDTQAMSSMSSVGRLAALLTVTLADAGVLPLQLSPSAHELRSAIGRLTSTFAGLLPNHTVGALHSSVRQVRDSVAALESFVTYHLDYRRADDVRLVNSVALHFDSLCTRIIHTATSLLDRYRVSDNRRGGGRSSRRLLSVSPNLQDWATDGCRQRRTDGGDAERLLAADVSALLAQIWTAAGVISLAR